MLAVAACFCLGLVFHMRTQPSFVCSHFYNISLIDVALIPVVIIALIAAVIVAVIVIAASATCCLFEQPAAETFNRIERIRIQLGV